MTLTDKNNRLRRKIRNKDDKMIQTDAPEPAGVFL